MCYEKARFRPTVSPLAREPGRNTHEIKMEWTRYTYSLWVRKSPHFIHVMIGIILSLRYGKERERKMILLHALLQWCSTYYLGVFHLRGWPHGRATGDIWDTPLLDASFPTFLTKNPTYDNRFSANDPNRSTKSGYLVSWLRLSSRVVLISSFRWEKISIFLRSIVKHSAHLRIIHVSADVSITVGQSFTWFSFP